MKTRNLRLGQQPLTGILRQIAGNPNLSSELGPVSHKFTPDCQAAEKGPILPVSGIDSGHDADAAGEVGIPISAGMTCHIGIHNR